MRGQVAIFVLKALGSAAARVVDFGQSGEILNPHIGVSKIIPGRKCETLRLAWDFVLQIQHW